MSSERLQITLAALAEMAVLVPSIFSSNYKNIVREFVVKQVLVVDRVRMTVDYVSDPKRAAFYLHYTVIKLEHQSLCVLIYLATACKLSNYKNKLLELNYFGILSAIISSNYF